MCSHYVFFFFSASSFCIGMYTSDRDCTFDIERTLVESRARLQNDFTKQASSPLTLSICLPPKSQFLLGSFPFSALHYHYPPFSLSFIAFSLLLPRLVIFFFLFFISLALLSGCQYFLFRLNFY